MTKTIDLRQALEEGDNDSIVVNLNDIAEDMFDFMEKWELSEKDLDE